MEDFTRHVDPEEYRAVADQFTADETALEQARAKRDGATNMLGRLVSGVMVHRAAVRAADSGEHFGMIEQLRQLDEQNRGTAEPS